VCGFGIIDEASQSVAICEPHQIVGYGNPTAATALIAAYGHWTELFMVSVEPFDLTVHPTSAVVTPQKTAWIDKRGDAKLVWSLKEGYQVR